MKQAGQYDNDRPAIKHANAPSRALGLDICRTAPEIPTSNVRQLALLIQHGDVRADIADVAAKRPKV